MALSAAYSVDASLDSVQFCSRSLASNVGLRSWEVDTGSQARLASPFFGGKLFGQGLDPLLIESKDKNKVLPTGNKSETKSKMFQSFRSFQSQGRNRGQQRFKPKWQWSKGFQRQFKSQSSQGPFAGNKRTKDDLGSGVPAPRVGAQLLSCSFLESNNNRLMGVGDCCQGLLSGVLGKAGRQILECFHLSAAGQASVHARGYQPLTKHWGDRAGSMG